MSGAARTRGNTQSTVSAVGDSLEKLLFSEKVQTGKEVTDKRHPSSPEESTAVGPSAGVSGSLHPPTFDYGISMAMQMSWGDFVSLPFNQVNKANLVFNQPDTSSLFVCPDDIVKTLKRQKLSLEDIEWCKWALSPTGGKVQVGKSYGTLNKGERTKYDNFNCDEVLAGKNPSCDDVRRINPSLVSIYFISFVIRLGETTFLMHGSRAQLEGCVKVLHWALRVKLTAWIQLAMPGSARSRTLW
jgi:hypothetical protein